MAVKIVQHFLSRRDESCNWWPGPMAKLLRSKYPENTRSVGNRWHAMSARSSWWVYEDESIKMSLWRRRIGWDSKWLDRTIFPVPKLTHAFYLMISKHWCPLYDDWQMARQMSHIIIPRKWAGWHLKIRLYTRDSSNKATTRWREPLLTSSYDFGNMYTVSHEVWCNVEVMKHADSCPFGRCDWLHFLPHHSHALWSTRSCKIVKLDAGCL